MNNICDEPMKTDKEGKLINCSKCNSSFHMRGSKCCWNCGHKMGSLIEEETE